MNLAAIADESIENNPVEAGTVRWNRDYDAALKQSNRTGKPVFLLFQEIPGCAGCQAFGRNVLSNPLLVEAIEDEFIPVLVYNNRSGGNDEILRRQFNEPAWNYQVVRFLDANGRDLIPRKDLVWTIEGIASRSIKALKAAQRPVPKYLETLIIENDVNNQGECAFAMACFWVGEMELGSIDGVVETEAGYLDGHEVTKVVYMKNEISLDELAAKAAQVKCAQKVYTSSGEKVTVKNLPTGRLSANYRKAGASDQKKQISRWQEFQSVPGITDMQLTKINAFATKDVSKAMEWLSPRQRRYFQTEMQKKNE